MPRRFFRYTSFLAFDIVIIFKERPMTDELGIPVKIFQKQKKKKMLSLIMSIITPRCMLCLSGLSLVTPTMKGCYLDWSKVKQMIARTQHRWSKTIHYFSSLPLQGKASTSYGCKIPYQNDTFIYTLTKMILSLSICLFHMLSESQKPVKQSSGTF